MPGCAGGRKLVAEKRKVLFVCVENSNRSQMAEAFAHMLGGAAVESFSAGSKPSGAVNPRALAAMGELGYDLSRHRSKSLAEVPQDGYDAVITMGCGDACPFIQARLREDWGLPDPKLMVPEEFRKVRDLIGEKVKELLGRL
jgi:protein-tyrosine-phosphatase